LGLRPVGAPCEPIVSNLPGHDLSLCRVVER
jgi:C-terminal, D2-small domain, of ClpB protein